MSDAPAAAPSSAPSAPASTPTPSAPTSAPAPTSQASSTPTPTPSAQPTPATPEKQKFKLKVNGQEKELELSHEELIQRLQKDEAAELRMQRAAEQEKKFAARDEALKKDPLKYLSDELKLENLDAIIEDRLAEKYRLEAMSEEERRQVELTKKLEHYEKQEAKRQEEVKQQEYKAAVDRAFQDRERLYTDALSKSGLEGNMELLATMAQIDLQLLEHNEGLPPEEQINLTPEQLAAEAKARFEKPMAAYKGKLAKLEGEALLSELGKEVVDRVLKASLAKLGTASAAKALKPAAPKPQIQDDEPRNPKSKGEDYEKFWRNMTWGSD